MIDVYMNSDRQQSPLTSSSSHGCTSRMMEASFSVEEFTATVSASLPSKRRKIEEPESVICFQWKDPCYNGNVLLNHCNGKNNNLHTADDILRGIARLASGRYGWTMSELSQKILTVVSSSDVYTTEYVRLDPMSSRSKVSLAAGKSIV